VNGFLLFSKLKGGTWPKKGLVKKRFELFANGENLNYYDTKVKKDMRRGRKVT
jgi:hypothetical protein